MTSPNSVFDSITVAIQRAADYNRGETVPPACILWTDEKREWEALVPRLRQVLPSFLILGPYDPVNRSGPAIWLRCALAGKVPEISWLATTVPILYLPGVSRATLRATEECPDELKPLAELQYRGVFWSQVSGKDWTVAAFLQSNHGGLQLRLARDTATSTSIRRSLDKLVDVPVAELKAKSASGELNSSFFDSLISDDPIDDLLSWLSDPKGTRERWEPGRWDTLCSRCLADYGFDPDRDGELKGAELLGVQEKAVWKSAWKRYEATPGRYPGLPELLRKAKPQPKTGDLLAGVRSGYWPQDNEALEAELRQALLRVPAMPLDTARLNLRALEMGHKARREWVWSKLNRSPLAQAIVHLATLAEVTSSPVNGAKLGDMVKAYTDGGWRADLAVLESLAAVTSHQDREAVSAAVVHVYKPWLRDAAELFQERAKAQPIPGKSVPRLSEISAGTCLLFVDGLRFDVGQRLKQELEPRVGEVEVAAHLAALPSVTPTSKPAVSPVATRITGSAGGEEFRPCLAMDGKDLTPDRFRTLLEDAGYQVLSPTGVGDPVGRAWTEFGNIDRTGHSEGIGLAHRIPDLIRNLVLRIEGLLEAGWQEVRIVTDHGWLLMPKGLPKADLPKYLTATRWRRCAVVKESAMIDLTCFEWFWSESVRIATPPGIDCFLAGEEYNHGGLSLQECVVPQLSIRARKPAGPSARIEQVKWAGMRCRIKVTGDYAGCFVDLRLKLNDPKTSIVEARPVAADGSVAVVVANDEHAGRAANLVLLDGAGTVIDKQAVTVGG
jgi:hypothetical protein